MAAIAQASPASASLSKRRTWGSGNVLRPLILTIAAGIESDGFEEYLHGVDAANEFLHPALAEEMGRSQARLFLLKLSNLLVSKYECMHRHTTVISHPIGLIVDPANGCGLSCPGCVHTDNSKVNNFDWPKGMLPESVFASFLDQHAVFAFDLYLANYGEPLLNRNVPRFVERARRFLLPTYASTSLSVKNIDFEALVRSKLNFLIISIDGATEETYLKYRRKGNFALVLENLKKLVETKKRLGSYNPVLQWQFLVFEHSVHEVEAVQVLARELGVDEVRLVKPYEVDWDDPTIVVRAGWQTRTVRFQQDFDRYTESLAELAADVDTEAIDTQYEKTWTERLADMRRIRMGQGLALDPDRGPVIRKAPECTWLYKSATMDAHGRIMPCTRPPSTTDVLAFGKQADPMHFNSDKHRLARMFFADPDRFRSETRELPFEDVPFCSRCWHPNTKLDIDTREIVRKHMDSNPFFEALDEECKRALTDW